jgi:hypothetical protein
MLAALRPILVTLAAAVSHAAGSPRRLAERTILRSKHWPSDGIAGRVFLAAASIGAVVLLAATTVSPDRYVWS